MSTLCKVASLSTYCIQWQQNVLLTYHRMLSLVIVSQQTGCYCCSASRGLSNIVKFPNAEASKFPSFCLHRQQLVPLAYHTLHLQAFLQIAHDLSCPCNSVPLTEGLQHQPAGKFCAKAPAEGMLSACILAVLLWRTPLANVIP